MMIVNGRSCFLERCARSRQGSLGLTQADEEGLRGGTVSAFYYNGRPRTVT